MVKLESNWRFIMPRNVSRRTYNMMRREHRANPALADVLKRMEHRQGIIFSPKGKKEHELRERYLDENYVKQAAEKLFVQYKEINITWAACVQAIKTNFAEQLHSKWGPRLKAHREEQKAKKGTVNIGS
ncbi:hypothetical protein LCGC14_0891560 [marine sediment metagenome]|uniref:Uncharacterized protein n=1 Tax=marine sediment metagenome TaxID=412755 RepID=A0A0F9RIG8_9ZZZZ